MKRKFIVLFFLVSVSTIAFAQKADKSSLLKGKEVVNPKTLSYTFTYLTSVYADLVNPISINNGEIWDDPEYTISVPFEFEMNGTLVTILTFTSAGGMLMAPTESADVSEIIAPFDTDLVDRGEGSAESISPISYLVEGNTGSRILKIEWKNAGAYNEDAPFSMFVNFQVWIYEGSKIIEFHYGPSSITDASLFYAEASGAIIALATYDPVNDILSNANFVTGDAASPVIFEDYLEITGTPANGMVYRFVPAGTTESVQENNAEIAVYPNPAQNILNIEIANTGTASVSIKNIVGQSVKEISLNQLKNTINISDLSSGMYLLKVVQNGQIYTNKLIVK